MTKLTNTIQINESCFSMERKIMNTEDIKRRYPEGTRIRLGNMNDAHAVPDGTLGTVQFVDDIGTIHVSWDNGSSLGLIVGEDDFSVVIGQEKVKDYEIRNVRPFSIFATWKRKDPRIEVTDAFVDRVVILGENEYGLFKNNLMKDYDFIVELNNRIFADNDSALYDVILVKGENSIDGVLVNSEGAKYARYSCYVPDVTSFIEPSQENVQENKRSITVLIVEPNEHPKLVEIEDDIDVEQAIVGGYMEELQLSDTASLICNEEGKLRNLPANRRYGNDVLAGTFFITGVDDDEGIFTSLSKEDIDFYSEVFHEIEDIDQSEVRNSIGYTIVPMQ